MERLIYLDTNIYIDYFKNRTDYLRPLGEFAFELLRRTFSCEFKIIVSNWVLKELEQNGFSKQSAQLIKRLKEMNKVAVIEYANNDSCLAKKLCNDRKIHYSDALHAAIAYRAGAEYLVTRNVSDFECVKDIIKVRCPEWL